MTPTSSGRSSNAARSRTSTTLTTVMIRPEMVQPLVPVSDSELPHQRRPPDLCAAPVCTVLRTAMNRCMDLPPTTREPARTMAATSSLLDASSRHKTCHTCRVQSYGR